MNLLILSTMKKMLLVLCGIFAATMAKSQNVIDNFIVGPYEVDYKGEGDVNYRLRKGMNLYEYFGLKKDTVVVGQVQPAPISKAFEFGLRYSMPRFDVQGAFNSFGAYGTRKMQIGSHAYFDFGVMVALSYGNYNERFGNLKDVLFEAGIPLAVEFAKLERDKSSLYASIGVAPAYYTTISATENVGGTETDAEKENGLYIAPQLEVGGYMPVLGHLLKIGVYGEYRIDCSGGDVNVFEQRIGRFFVGAKVGLVI